MTETSLGTSFSAWRNRVQDLLLADVGPVAVLADRDCGVDFVLAGLGTADRPLAWFRLDEHDLDDPASQGNKLGDAMARAVGAVLFGYGLPLSDAVNQICRAHAVLGPFTVVASCAEFLGAGATELLKLSIIGSRVILVFGSEMAWSSSAGYVSTMVDPRQLRVTLDEAEQLAAGRVSTEELGLLHDSSSGQFVSLLKALGERRGAVPIIVPDPDGATVLGLEGAAINTEVLVDALYQRGRPSEALELALRSGSGFGEDLVDSAGWEHASRGLHDRLWRLLASMPPGSRRQSPTVMRWYFAAATAGNRHNSVKAEVSRYLQDHEAPELRALFAAAFPGQGFLEETSRALKSLVSPTTLRIHAFALAQAGKSDDSVRFLQQALRLSEVLGQDSLVVACATDLADFWIKRGHYSDAGEWARWALQWYYTSGLKDELRRLVASALSVYARILIGDVSAVTAIIDELNVEVAGIPTSEAIVSTRADWAFVNGDFQVAERLYALNIERLHMGQLAYLAIDHVHALVALNKSRPAQDVARRAQVLTRHLDPLARALGDLAMGLAVSDSDPADGLRWLEGAQRTLAVDAEAPRLAQASIALAKLHLRQGREDAAREALVAGEPALRELGFTGWTLLGGFDPEVKLLYQLFHGKSDELELHFLGGERIVYHGRPIELGLRQCECLVVMASRPQGVSAERLGMEVYGEASVHSTLKAIVSRLRQVVPIENRPYRVGVSMWSDFVELERLLAAGRVREAMSLYRGPLLPRSDAPAVVELRDHLDESIRRAVLRAGDVEALLQLAKLSESDLELFEVALERLSPNDPRFPIVRARLEQVRRNWQQA
jgi:hypothetical protein